MSTLGQHGDTIAAAFNHHWNGCIRSSTAQVSSPDTYVGSNACACCSGTQKLLDSETGACYDPNGV